MFFSGPPLPTCLFTRLSLAVESIKVFLLHYFIPQRLNGSYDASTSSSLLAWWLLEKQRSLQQAAEVFMLLSTNTLRLITALWGSWCNVTVGSLEMTTLQQLLVLWCSSKEKVNMVGSLLGEDLHCLTFPGLMSSLSRRAFMCSHKPWNPQCGWNVYLVLCPFFYCVSDLRNVLLPTVN